MLTVVDYESVKSSAVNPLNLHALNFWQKRWVN